MITNNYLYNPHAIMLHEQTRHTNIDRPYNRYVAGETFPEQITELLNTEVTLKYRNYDIVDDNMEAVCAGRPEDDQDYDFYNREIGAEDFDQIDVYENKFRVIRADSSEPFVLIGISEDYSKILVNSTRIEEDGEYRFKKFISSLPQQLNNYFGLEVENRHTGEIETIPGVTIRVDDKEATYSIIVEFLGSTNTIRVVLGDECFSRIVDYLNDDYNFDAKRAGNNTNDYADINGHEASHEGLITMNIDAGHSNNMYRLFFNRSTGNVGIDDLKNDTVSNPEDEWYEEGHDHEIPPSDKVKYSHIRELTKEEIINFRKMIFEGRNIYGSV
jgi:hypothetical protein